MTTSNDDELKPPAIVGVPLWFNMPSATSSTSYNGLLSKHYSVTMHPLGMLLSEFLNRKQADPIKLPAKLEACRIPENDDKDLEKQFETVLTEWVDNNVKDAGSSPIAASFYSAFHAEVPPVNLQEV
jgi:hypothetical protein